MPETAPKYQEVTRYISGYIKPDDRKAWQAIGVTVIYQLAVWGLLHYNLRLLGWTLNILNMIRMFVQFHDMAHFSFFSSISLNRAVGKVIGVYVHFPFDMWRQGHNHHHKHFGNLDRTDLSQTIFFTKKQYSEMKMPTKIIVRIFREPIVFFFITVQILWFFGILYNCIKKYGVFSAPVAEKLLSTVILVWVFDWLGLSGWGMYVSFHLTQTLGNTLFHLQHSVNLPYRQRQQQWNFAKAALEGSTYLQVPQILRTFTNGIEYHHIHHLNTNIASYNIHECHQKFDNKDEGGAHWDKYGINRVDLWLAFRSMFNVMLDEENSTLLPFSYTSL